MTRTELLEALVCERYAPVDREWVDTRDRPVLPVVADSFDDGPGAQVIQLPVRRRAA